MSANIQPFLEYLVIPEFALSYSGVLFVIFLLFLSRLVWKYRRLLGDVTRAQEALDEVGSPEAFWTQYQSLNQALKENRTLGHAWSEFTESLVTPEAADARQVVQNSKEPSEQFDMATIVEPLINIRGYNAIPNYLTGLGILGTFIGLAAGIYLAEPYLASSSDVSGTAQGLKFLLSGASLAFTTSITGLVTSILFLFIERSLVSRLVSAIGDWNATLDSVLVLATPGKIAIRQLRELRQQTTQLKHFNTDLASSIAAALDEKIAGRLAPQLDKLIEAVEGMRGDRRSTSEGMVEQVVEELRESLTGAAGTEMSALASTLEQLDETLRSSVEGIDQNKQAMTASLEESRAVMSDALDESMQQLSRQMAAATNNLSDRLERSAEKISSSLGASSEEAVERFSSAMENFSSSSTQELERFIRRISISGDEMAASFRTASDDAAAAVAKSADQVQQQTQQTQQLLEEIQRTASSLSGVTREIRQTGAGLADLGPRLDEAARAFQTASQKITRTTSDLDTMSRRMVSSAEALTETQRSLREAWEEHLDRFENADESMRQVFAEIDTGLERFMERVASFNKKFDSEMSDAVGLLGGAVTELGEILEDSIDALTEREGGV